MTAQTLWDELFTVNTVSKMKTNLLTNSKAICRDRQPIGNENNAAEQEGSNTSNDAANAIKKQFKTHSRIVAIKQQSK